MNHFRILLKTKVSDQPTCSFSEEEVASASPLPPDEVLGKLEGKSRAQKFRSVFHPYFFWRSNRIYYIPHKIELEKKKGKISIPRIMRSIWVTEWDNYIRQHKDEAILCIYGEFSSTETVAVALELGLPVKVIVGKRLVEESRDYAVKLKKIYGDLFELYTYNVRNSDNGSEEPRPKYHSCLIGRNILFEEKHGLDNEYQIAKVIEYADDGIINRYKNHFLEELKNSSEKLTAQEISKLQTFQSDHGSWLPYPDSPFGKHITPFRQTASRRRRSRPLYVRHRE
jgi:hypothetical protein